MTFAWHVHHMRLYETLQEGGIEKRQGYIRESKPRKERPRRLRLLKVVKEQVLLQSLDTAKINSYGVPAVRVLLHKAITALHDSECKRCTWNGKTIFPKPLR